jgi:dihydroorotase
MPRVSEEIAVYKACALARETGCPIHILHVSTKGGVDVIRQFKAEGAPVTGEVGPHHFSLTDEAVRGYNTNAKMNPPLRTQEDLDALIEGLKDGTIDLIATDHAPHAAHEKEREFDHAPFGINGLETSLPVSIQTLVEGGHLTLSELIDKMSTVPAKLLGLDGGSLTVGARADVTIFDPKAKWTLDKNALASKSKNTPYAGHEMTGRVKATLVDGAPVFNEL